LLDRDGVPSSDPGDYLSGGSLLPVGGGAGSHKGYSLIVLMELLVGLLTGAAFCGPGQPPFSNSFVLIALDAGTAASTRMPEVADLVGWIKSSRLRTGSEILVPGELEARRRGRAGGSVTLDHVTVAQLDAVAERIGVESRLADLGGDIHSEPVSA
jgi:LDH2 family malate/lactate/ureidoglycolate dehydrogenase